MRVECRKLEVNPLAPQEREAMMLVPENYLELHLVREYRKFASTGMRLRGTIEIFMSDGNEASSIVLKPGREIANMQEVLPRRVIPVTIIKDRKSDGRFPSKRK